MNPSPAVDSAPMRLFLFLGKRREVALVAVLVALVLFTGSVRPAFLSTQTLMDVLLNVAIVSLLSAGMTGVMLMRHIDLSVSSTLGLSAYAVGALFVAHPHMPILVAMGAGIAIGLVAGAINAAMVVFGNVPSLVATLSTLYIYRGADYAWVHGGQVNASNLPAGFADLGTASLLGMPVLVLIAGAVLVAFSIYLGQFPGGREHYAVGSNPEAARLAGIRVGRRVAIGFVTSGAIAGLAGVLWLARFGTVDASTGTGLELQVVAAAVVGSVAITGGAGTILGATLGALILGVISISLVVLRVSPFWEQAIQGLLIVLAIASDAALARALARRLREKRRHG